MRNYDETIEAIEAHEVVTLDEFRAAELFGLAPHVFVENPANAVCQHCPLTVKFYDGPLDLRTTIERDQLTGYYRHEQLVAAFDKVKNRNHWKNPIDSFCHVVECPVVLEAIVFFTATVPTFHRVGQTPLMHVKADGYYRGPANTQLAEGEKMTTINAKILPGMARISKELTKLERIAEILSQRDKMVLSTGIREAKREIQNGLQEILLAAKNACP